MRNPIALLVLVLSLASSVQAGLQEAFISLDDAIKEVSLKTVLPKLAETLQIEEPLLEKAMVQQKLKLSEVGMAKLISEKNGQPIANLLAVSAAGNWLELMNKHGVKEADAVEFLDNLQSEVAFSMLDFKQARKK